MGQFAMAKIESLKDHGYDFVTTKEAADYLGCSPRHLQREIEKGALPARKYGRASRILITDFRLYVGTTDADPRMKPQT